MIDAFLKYQSLLKTVSADLNTAGYTVQVSCGKKRLVDIGSVSSRSFFGVLGSVEILDTDGCISLLTDIGLSED